MSAFGPAPIPGAVQASFIATQAQPARAREKSKPQDADPTRPAARDEVRLSDPLQSDAIDPKPDAAEEWKQGRRRGRTAFVGRESDRAARGGPPADGTPHVDVKA